MIASCEEQGEISEIELFTDDLASTVGQLYVVLNGKLTCLISFKVSNFVSHRRKSHGFVAT